MQARACLLLNSGCCPNVTYIDDRKIKLKEKKEDPTKSTLNEIISNFHNIGTFALFCFSVSKLFNENLISFDRKNCII